MNPQWLVFNTWVESGRSLFSMEGQTFIDMVPLFFSFVVLAGLLTWLLYKPVKKVLQARADRVENDMKEAETSKKSAAELKAEYEQKVRDIEVERASILDEARKLAVEKRDQIIAAAKAEAQDEKARASRDIATEKEQVKGAVHQAIIEISTEMAARLISATVDQKTHDRLFSEALTELEATAAFRTDAATV